MQPKRIRQYSNTEGRDSTTTAPSISLTDILTSDSLRLPVPSTLLRPPGCTETKASNPDRTMNCYACPEISASLPVPFVSGGGGEAYKQRLRCQGLCFTEAFYVRKQAQERRGSACKILEAHPLPFVATSRNEHLDHRE